MLRLDLQQQGSVDPCVILEASLSVKQFETGFLARAYFSIKTPLNCLQSFLL